MSNSFEQMAMAASQTNEVNTEMEINDLKSRLDQITKSFNFKIGELEAVKTEQKSFQNNVKSEQKKNKIKSDMIKTMLEGQSQGVFIGDQPAQENQFDPNPFPLFNAQQGEQAAQ